MTAVEWLVEKIFSDFGKSVKSQEIKMAMQMEKQQIIDAFDEGQEYEYQYHINNAPKFDSQTYFIETYGSNGSDENFKQFSLYEHKETIATADTPIYSQIEISDEEIWQVGDMYANQNTINDDNDLAYFKGQLSGFFDGAKWYREQLRKGSSNSQNNIK